MLLTLTDKAKSTFKANTPGRLVAVDFDDRTLRVVQADPHRSLPRFRKLADIQAPDGLDVDDAKAVGRFIADSLRELGLDGMRVVMDVPRSQAVLKTILLPNGASDSELPAMVRYQAERELPFPIAEAVVDFTVVDRDDSNDALRHLKKQDASEPMDSPGRKKRSGSVDRDGDGSEGNIEVLVAAVRHSVVERFEQIAQSAGIKLQSLGLRPYADIRCLEACLPPERRRENIVLVHVLALEAEINVLINGSLVFSRSTPIKRRDENHEPLPQEQVTDLLAVQVVRSVQSALTSQSDLTIDHLYIAGDSDEVKPLVDALQRRWKGNCEQLDPLGTLPMKRAKTDGKGSITPLGLAIAHASAGVVPFDFLDPKKPPVERDVQKIRRIAMVASAAVVFLAFVVYGIVSRAGYESQLEALVAQYNSLEKESRPIAKLGKKARDLEGWVDGGVDWIDHWANVAAAFPDATDAYITNMKTNSQGAMTFTVKARSNKIISALSRRLAAAGYVVKMGAESTAVNEYGYPYSTSIRIDLDEDQPVDVASLKAVPRPDDDGSETLIRYKRSSSSIRRSTSFTNSRSDNSRSSSDTSSRSNSTRPDSSSSSRYPSKTSSNNSSSNSKDSKGSGKPTKEQSDKDKGKDRDKDRSRDDDQRKSYDKRSKFRR